MKSSILAFLGFAGAAFAHGIVTDICIDGHFYDLYDPAKTPNIHPKPDIPGWTVPGPAPVTDVESAAIACNDGSQNGTIYATAYAGAEVTFFWTKWPASHQGPVMTYLASVSSDNPTELDFFKIDHSGLYPDGTWATDKLIANNNSYTVHIPKDLLAGHYVLRHEILALQDANVASGAQFYPVCINLEISGYGAAVPTNTVKFPGAYKPDDSDILIDIYHPHPITSYKIPGPAPYVAGPMPYPTIALPTPASNTSDIHSLKPEFKYPPSSYSSSSSSSSYAPSAGYYVYHNSSSLAPTYYAPSTYSEPMTTIYTVVTKTKFVTRTHKRHPTSSSTSSCKKKTTTTPPPPVYPEATPTAKDKDTSPPPPVVYVTKTVHKTVTVTDYKKKHATTETETVTKTKTKTKTVTVTETPSCSPAGRYSAYF